GVRPNSPPQMTSVSSSMPRCFRSFTRAVQARSVSAQFFFRSFTRFPCWSHASWNSWTKRTPRSTSRRASRQLFAKDDLPGCAPYISSVSLDSLVRSISSGALDCIRKAISNELILVAISGSPTTSSRCSLSLQTASSDARWRSASTPGGLDRYSTGSPVPRNWTPWYRVGRKPQPQFELPPLGPFLPELKTTKPGRSRDSLPRPYVTHAPMLGRPNCCAPVFIMICAGAWLNASVAHDFTIVRSSTIVARCGRSSEISVPFSPYLPNRNFGPSSFELGLMNAAR